MRLIEDETKTSPGVSDAWTVKPDKAAMACQCSVSLALVSDFQPTKKRGVKIIFSPTSSRLYSQDWSEHTSHNSITPKAKTRDQELGAGVDDTMKPLKKKVEKNIFSTTNETYAKIMLGFETLK